ncbi:hypothetical protein LPJ73_005941 [Coemansia sp. RSA 2703]|nr:hypothetical protein LPJ73_005941 [Coemansia sp. RSA 2703]
MTASDDANGSDKQRTAATSNKQPTWEEVERTRTPLRRTSHWRLCVVDRFFTTTTDLTSRPRTITGRMRCLEHNPSSTLHAGWRLVRVLDIRNIEKFQQHSRKKPSAAQNILEQTIPETSERQALASVEPLRQVAVRWAGEFTAFCRRVVRPGVDMSRQMVESWSSGAQQSLFALLWRDTMQLKGVRVVARMPEVVERIFGDVDDVDGVAGDVAGRRAKERDAKKDASERSDRGDKS